MMTILAHWVTKLIGHERLVVLEGDESERENEKKHAGTTRGVGIGLLRLLLTPRLTSQLQVHSLLSLAHALRTLMFSARRFAPGTSLGSVRMGMMDKLPPRGWRWVVFGAFLLVGQPALAQAPSAKLADYFGFQPLELYKLDNRIGNLQLKDLDGDKIDDIIVSNNGRSRIDLLLSTKKADDDKSSRPFRKDPNELEYDRRMRLVSIPVNKEVVSVDTGDFNGDGKPDLVFYGTPAEVEILFNEGKGHFGSPKKINTGDAVQRSAALTVGDLDQDGRDDLALLAEKELIFVYQTAPGVLGEPERVPHTAGNPWLIKAVDIDGNGAKDLVIVDTESDHPIHVRFATDEKKLGPEQRFALEVPRAVAFGQIDGQGGSEILVLEGHVGPGQGADARPVGRRRGQQARPAGVLRTAAGDRARPFAGGRRPRRRSHERRHRDRPGQRPGLGLPPDGPLGPQLGTDLPQPGQRADRPPRPARGRRQGRGLRPLRAREADRPERFRQGPAVLPDARFADRRAGRDGRGRPRRRQVARDPLRVARTTSRAERRSSCGPSPGTNPGRFGHASGAKSSRSRCPASPRFPPPSRPSTSTRTVRPTS